MMGHIPQPPQPGASTGQSSPAAPDEPAGNSPALPNWTSLAVIVLACCLGLGGQLALISQEYNRETPQPRDIQPAAAQAPDESSRSPKLTNATVKLPPDRTSVGDFSIH